MAIRKTDLIYTDTSDPTGSENFAAGFTYGDDWRNTSSGEVFTCVGDGVWKSITAVINSGVKIKTGTYTGDGTTSQGITGVGFTPKYVRIWPRETSDGTDVEIYETTDTIIDDNANGMAVIHAGSFILNYHEVRDNTIISLDSDGFTVDDDGVDDHPNENNTVYNFIALG